MSTVSTVTDKSGTTNRPDVGASAEAQGADAEAVQDGDAAMKSNAPSRLGSKPGSDSKPGPNSKPGPGADHPSNSKAKSAPVTFNKQQRSLLGRFMRDWIFPRRKQIYVAFAWTVLLAAASSAYPPIIKFSIDKLTKPEGAHLLPWVLAVIILITMARSIFLYLQTVTTNGVIMRMTTDLQKRGFEHLVAADYARITRETPGHLVSRLTNDITFIQQAGQAALNTAIRDTLIIAALVGMMFWLDWMMSVIVLFVYPIAAAPIAIIGTRLRMVAKRTQRQLGDMTSMLTEKLSGARLIKTFRLEDYASGRVNKNFEQVFGLRMKAVRNRARLDPMLEAMGGVAVAGVVGLAYWRIDAGVITVGDFAGFLTALMMAAQPIRGLGNLNAKVQEGLAAIERVYQLFDEKPSIVSKPGAKPLAIDAGEINFDRVAFSYDGNKDGAAVRDFSLTIPGGKTVAFVGRSGAGKTTVINLVPRLFDVTGGSISIDGQPLHDVTVESLRDHISIVSQDVTLFDDSIRANIALGRLDADNDAIIAAAKAAAAHDFIEEQPDGYDTQIGDRGMRLSGGQRQRLALARAILKDAPILLLDEATSALDTQSERLVQDALAKFTKNRTTLVIAHRLSTVKDADLICVMDAGTLVELGSHDELTARGGIYAQLCRQQFLGGKGEPSEEL